MFPTEENSFNTAMGDVVVQYHAVVKTEELCDVPYRREQLQWCIILRITVFFLLLCLSSGILETRKQRLGNCRESDGLSSD
jgi:hypothetical protein